MPTWWETLSELRGKHYAAPLSFTTEHGSLRGSSVQNQPFLFRLLRSLFLYLCGFLYHVRLNFSELKPHTMQLHCKHTGLFIRHFLHIISGFRIGAFSPSLIPLLGTLALQKMAFHSFSLLPFNLLGPPFQLLTFLLQHLQLELCVIAASKL